MPFQVDLTALDNVSSFPELALGRTNPTAFSPLQYSISPWRYATLSRSTSKHTLLSQPYTRQTPFGTRYTFLSSSELQFTKRETLKLSRPRAIKFVAGVFTSTEERKISISSATPLSMLVSF